jgi:hypothetical protein
MSGLYADVLAGLEVDATAPLPAPQVCPVRLDELLAPAPDAARQIERFVEDHPTPRHTRSSGSRIKGSFTCGWPNMRRRPKQWRTDADGTGSTAFAHMGKCVVAAPPSNRRE